MAALESTTQVVKDNFPNIKSKDTLCLLALVLNGLKALSDEHPSFQLAFAATVEAARRVKSDHASH